MDVQMTQKNKTTWIFEDHGVRFFLLAGCKQALLIDSGMRVHNARDIASSLTPLPIHLLNTHADMDHIGSNEQFSSFYMNQKEEPNYRRRQKGGTILPIQEGDRIDLGNRPLEIIELPGHTPGSIAVLDVNNRVLISGDPIQRNGRIFMFGEFRDMRLMVKGLDHLSAFTPQFDEIWPSHADLPLPIDAIDQVKAGAEAILAGSVKGQPELLFGHSIVAYDVGYTVFLCER